MGYLRSFDGFTPPARFDSVAFTQVAIEESANSTGPWTQIDTRVLATGPGVVPTGLDANPALPQARDITTSAGTIDPIAWYRLVWKDGAGGLFPAGPIPFNSEDSSSNLATIADVANILQVSVTELDANAISNALEVATSWVKIFLRDPNLGLGGTTTESFYDLREDADMPATGTVTSVSVVDIPGSDPRLLDATEWSYDGSRVRLRPNMLVLWDESGSDPDDDAVTERIARTLIRVDVTSTRTSGVDPLIKQACALAATSLWTRSPRAAQGLTGEHIGDYSYTVASLKTGDPFFEEAKSLLRSFRGARRETLVP